MWTASERLWGLLVEVGAPLKYQMSLTENAGGKRSIEASDNIRTCVCLVTPSRTGTACRRVARTPNKSWDFCMKEQFDYGAQHVVHVARTLQAP